MKNYVLLIAIFFIAFLPKAIAQSFEYEIHAGANITNTISNTYSICDNSGKVGFEVGGGINYSFKNGIALQSGLNFMQSRYRISVMSNYVNDLGQGFVEYPAVNTNILSAEIPLGVAYRIKFNNGFELIPNVGVYGRLGISSIKDCVSVANYEDSYKWNCFSDFTHDSHMIKAFRRLDGGISAGLTVVFANHYQLAFNYRRGLVYQSCDFKNKHQSLSLLVGYRF